MNKIHAAYILITRAISFIYPEPYSMTVEEEKAIRERCRKSYQRFGHCYNPFPSHWKLRGAVWRSEVCGMCLKACSQILKQPEIVAWEMARELLGERLPGLPKWAPADTKDVYWEGVRNNV